TTFSSRWVLEPLRVGRVQNSRRLAKHYDREDPSKPIPISRRKKNTSPAWPRLVRPTPRSPRSSTSAPTPWTTTFEKSSANLASRPDGSSSVPIRTPLSYSTGSAFFNRTCDWSVEGGPQAPDSLELGVDTHVW